MKHRVRKTRIAAAALVAFLGGSVCRAGGSGTFQLFPPNGNQNPLLAPDPDEPGFSLSDTSVLDAEPRPVEEVRLDLRLPEAILRLQAPAPLPAPVLTRKTGLPGAWKSFATAFVFATAVGYSAGNSLKEEPYKGTFHFTSEGFFGRNTYTGGVDKAAHFIDYTIAHRTFENTFRRIGYTPGQSRWLSLAGSLAGGLTTEIGDGTRIFGFSWEDFAMDVLGAATAMGLSESGWNDTFGFRFGSIDQDKTPECCVQNTNVGRDYSGEIYVADLKISGLARRLKVNPGPARFLLLSLTYGTNGYNHGTPEIRQRLVGLEVGIHIGEILRAIGLPSEPVWGEVIYYVFDTFRIPFTAIGVRYDINNHEWFGPTAGRTPFRVPP